MGLQQENASERDAVYIDVSHWSSDLNFKPSTQSIYPSDSMDAILPSLGSSPSMTTISVDEENAASLTKAPCVESYWSIGAQIVIPFFFAGLGMVCAGIYLDYVQSWEVFIAISELYILVPPLLGLKGNLEMTLASRLSTQANLGNMETRKEQWTMIRANLVLVQCQAIVVGFLASIVAAILVLIMQQEFNLQHTLLLCACSLITASVASFLLGVVTSGVIVIAKHCHLNPDNVATPIAASLGDMTSLALLSWIANVLYQEMETKAWISIAIIVFYIFATPVCIWLSKRNKYTREVLYNGWTPVIIAMFISSIGGLILDNIVTIYSGVAIYQPVMNGVGGNLAAVQASRISTALHKLGNLGSLDDGAGICASPITVFFSQHTHSRTARVLLAMVIPGHIIFVLAINFFWRGNLDLVTLLFMVFYLVAALTQVLVLLYVAYVIIRCMWSRKTDPDNSAIPYLTALGDLLGTTLLGVIFFFLRQLGDESAMEI